MLLESNCPVETTIDLIGGKYKAIILWQLSEKTLRFSELHNAIPRATPKMLTQQLRELESHALIHRKIYPVIPPKGRVFSYQTRKEPYAGFDRNA